MSVSVVRLNGTPVYEWKGTKTRIPASNEKLVTAVAALSELGASARVHTAVAAVGEPSGSGVIHGSLYLVGGGDPTLSSADITRLARSVKASGVRRVTGSIVGDETLWDARRDAPGWKSGFLGEECPPLSALTLARNKAGRSATRAAAALLRALRKAGVKVNGVVRAGRAPAGAAPIALDASPRIDTMLRTMGKKSDNFTAEMLLKAVGAQRLRPRHDGRRRRARPPGDSRPRRVADRLARRRRLGPVGQGSHHDGPAGTAARGRVADAVDRRARCASRSAIAGRDGTLAGRMTTGPARGVVRAKTGTLNASSALSGYAGPYAFSVIVNGSAVNHSTAHALQDRIAQYLAREA